MIDMQSMKMGLKGLPSSELPSFFGTLKTGWTYIIPIATLVGMLISQFSAQTSCLVSLMVMIQVSYIRSDYRYGWIPAFCGLVAFFGFKVPIEVSSILSLVPLFIVAAVRKAIKEQWHKFAEGLEKGMATVPDTGVTIILAGILVSSMDITGVAVRLTGGLVSVAGGNLFFLLVLTAVAALILGIGLPTSAVYLLTAMLLAPALVKLGMLPIVAHFFAFYYGLAAMLSPPVCPVAFIAAGIAGAPFMRTGWLSMRLGIIVFIVPFMFAYTPALLMIGPPLQIVIACIVAFFAAYLLSAGFEGYLLTRAGIAERVVLFAGGILMMFPVFIFWYLVAAGFTMGLLVLLWQMCKRRSSSFPAGPTPA
jgi:TRAP transporter 4TM/12TM fusion protein